MPLPVSESLPRHPGKTRIAGIAVRAGLVRTCPSSRFRLEPCGCKLGSGPDPWYDFQRVLSWLILTSSDAKPYARVVPIS